ncbi:MAG: hypothetical protein ACREUE_07350, partial [Panacagrimonas sp.]
MRLPDIRVGEHYRPEQLLRQSGPMCLLDGVMGYGPDWIETRVDVRPDSRFGDAAGVPAWVGIEYMAQTIAAWSGIEHVQAGERPRIGLLVGCRRYACEVARFAPGQSLRVRAEFLMGDELEFAVFR